MQPRKNLYFPLCTYYVGTRNRNSVKLHSRKDLSNSEVNSKGLRHRATSSKNGSGSCDVDWTFTEEDRRLGYVCIYVQLRLRLPSKSNCIESLFDLSLSASERRDVPPFAICRLPSFCPLARSQFGQIENQASPLQPTISKPAFFLLRRRRRRH